MTEGYTNRGVLVMSSAAAVLFGHGRKDRNGHWKQRVGGVPTALIKTRLFAELGMVH